VGQIHNFILILRLRIVSFLTGGFGKVDRGSWFSSGEARSVLYAATNTSWGDSFIHHHASLSIHFRDKTYGHHTEGMSCGECGQVQPNISFNIG
jgi:hypothetical protein